MKKRLVIIPAFNEVGSIERTVEDIKKNAPSFDYVIINDHSMDGTKELCDRLGYNMVTLSINSGIGAAVQTGYLYGHRFAMIMRSRLMEMGSTMPSSWKRWQMSWRLRRSIC